MSKPSRSFNFSAGPAMLFPAVLARAQKELRNYLGSGFSIMEISHRSDDFLDVLARAKQHLRQLLAIPEHYEILMMQGGASSQFCALPLNFAQGFACINTVITGHWSQKAHQQMAKLNIAPTLAIANTAPDFHHIIEPENWNIHDNAAFVHFTSNETVNGIQFHRLPKLPANGVPLICDMSSDLLSRPICVEDFGVIYASAQKNIAPSGVCIVIIRQDLLNRIRDTIPDIWNYQAHIQRQGMYHTPSTFAIYMANLTFEHLLENGGIAPFQAQNQQKAQLLYHTIDNSQGFYRNLVHPNARSEMNVVFHTPTPEIDTKFIQEADQAGLKFLKGYATMGGIRASIYNAMPLEGVELLSDFMLKFAKKYNIK